MNIFLLDNDFRINASYYVDKHVVKMPLEYSQMLSTAYWVTKELGFCPRELDRNEIKAVLDSYVPGTFYKPTHINHPCNVWVRSSRENFLWLLELSSHLEKEWLYRFPKPAGTSHKAVTVARNIPYPRSILPLGLTELPQCVPEECQAEKTIDAYKKYYNIHKKHIHKWTKRQVPIWVAITKITPIKTDLLFNANTILQTVKSIAKPSTYSVWVKKREYGDKKEEEAIKKNDYITWREMK